MQQKQDRVITVLAANANPLVDSADVDKQFLVDSSRKVYGSSARDMVLSVSTVCESNSDQKDPQSENAQKETFGHFPDFLPHVNAPYQGITRPTKRKLGEAQAWAIFLNQSGHS
jgi:hypothetical protein